MSIQFGLHIIIIVVVRVRVQFNVIAVLRLKQRLMHPNRIAIEETERKIAHPSTKAAALKAKATEMRTKWDENSNKRSSMSLTLKLPIPCKTTLRLKPFIAIYPNDYTEERKKNNNYSVLHIDLNGLVEPSDHRKVKSSKGVFESPLPSGLDDSSDDEDTDTTGRSTGARASATRNTNSNSNTVDDDEGWGNMNDL